MPQSKVSVWILILTLSALLMACGGSSSSDPEPQQPPPGQSTPGDDNQPDVPGGNNEPEPEPEPITTPNSFSFAPQEGVTPGELVESNTITLGGITAAASISITNGEYKLGNGGFTAEAGYIEPGQSLTLRTTAPNRPDTTKETVVTVGGVAGRFIVHTMEDKEPPTASIIFPNVISATENTELTIRGTAEDALSEIARVTLIVNGTEEYEVESEDNFSTWKAKVALTRGSEHTITVSVEDEHGNVDTEAATAVVHQQEWEKDFPDNDNVFLSAAGITYDEKAHRVFIADPGTHTVIEVSLRTGKREEFFNGGVDFESATGLAVDKFRDRLLVANGLGHTIYSLNLAGERTPTLLNSRGYPDDSQPPFAVPAGIVLDPENPDKAFVTGNRSSNLAELDLITGRRTVLSDHRMVGADVRLIDPSGLLVDQNNNRILMGSGNFNRVVFAVDKTTGTQELFSSPRKGGGDVDFSCPQSLGSDKLAERILVGDCAKGIISVDIATRDRTLIKDPIGLEFANYGMHLYVEEGWQFLYYVDSINRALLMLDLETKEHVILSKGSAAEDLLH